MLSSTGPESGPTYHRLSMSLVVDSITKRFGPVLALDAASFTVEPRRIFGPLDGQRARLRQILRAARVAR
jgi:hypothetical protein